MSAGLCLHGADVWIKTLECQLRNFPGSCITHPPDVKNSSAGRHFPPLPVLGTCASKGKTKKNKIKEAKDGDNRNNLTSKEKSNKQTKTCCFQQEKCERRESEGSVSQGVADHLWSDKISNISLKCNVKHNTSLVSHMNSERGNKHSPTEYLIRDLLKPKSQFTHF